MKHLISVLLAGSFLLGASAEAYNTCNFFTYLSDPKYTKCTEQELQTFAKMAKEKEQALATERKEQEQKAIERKVTDSVLTLFIISAILAIIALFMEFGWIGAAGWLGVFFFGSICLEYAWLGNAGSAGAGGALLLAFGSCIAVFWGIFHRITTRKDRLFKANVEEMNYSRHDLGVSVNQEKRLVLVNGIEIFPAEFSYKAGETHKTVITNTGGSQTVYGSGGAVGTVYVPGTGGSYQNHTGYEVKLFNGDKEVSTATFTRKATESYEELVKVLNKVQTWCDEQKKDSALNALDVLCQQAGMESDCFKKSSWDDQGVLQWAIAADRNGKALAVYNNGTDTWVGTLKGASAQIINNKLEVKVDDAAYREQHLADRHFTILVAQSRDVLVEWESRLNLLAKKASEAV